MEGGVFGSTHFILSHDCIGVQGDPLTRALLENVEQFDQCIDDAVDEVGEGAGTSLDCRMLRSGIHRVPTMVSQISPLFHTSTVRPRSRRFISLHGEEMVD